MRRTIQFAALFFTAAVASPDVTLPETRLNPAEVVAAATRITGHQIGSSKLPGVKTTIVYGDPSKAAYYSMLLYVPAHTVIQAHSHRDNRMATVLSGTWNFGYGPTFDPARLKRLPTGSVYSEPAGTHHFARTNGSPVSASSSWRRLIVFRRARTLARRSEPLLNRLKLGLRKLTLEQNCSPMCVWPMEK